MATTGDRIIGRSWWK